MCAFRGVVETSHSKTLAPTARGVRQNGENGTKPGGLWKTGIGRTTEKIRGPSRPHLTRGFTANSSIFLTRKQSHQSIEHRKSLPGRWTSHDRGRRLPLVLYDRRTKDCVRPGFYEPCLYNKEFSHQNSNVNSCLSWKNMAIPHEKVTWMRIP